MLSKIQSNFPQLVKIQLAFLNLHEKLVKFKKESQCYIDMKN